MNRTRFLSMENSNKKMATRSRIGILNKDGTVESVYCHWDGYPDNNGKILLESYQTREKVQELFVKGDMSSLHYPVSNCKYYADRGETDVSSRLDLTLDQYRSIREEYQYYIDQNNQWWYNHLGCNFTPLEDYFKNKNIDEDEK